ncbi:ATP-binding protein [Methylobacterium sp. WL122]|nr:ATP-binding protein [Methylobacterium sp. WL122]
MLKISDADIRKRIERDNFWWMSDAKPIPEAKYPKRVYFEPFRNIALNFKVKRATVLLGPRRVGKTFMIKQLIHETISDGFNPSRILFASIDAPIYSGMSLESFIEFLPDDKNKEQYLVVFDEIQYLKNWEIHLKDLVDSFPNIKFVATGSAAAALKLKSAESGAGRFSDFMLPPLTFYEFLLFIGADSELIENSEKKSIAGRRYYRTNDIEKLNNLFIDYLNYGGYPEAVLNEEVRQNSEQFIRNDIIDRVLLKDLPSLYGIKDIPDLNKLFLFLAYNAGNEASLEKISQGSGISKPTITKYITYLESAFLIIKISTVDENCKTLQRERNFKIYLNNPSMRAALFGPVEASDTTRIGHLTESAIFSQWQHASNFRNLRYSRWKNEGEVDIVYLEGPTQKAAWIGEIKWSDGIEKSQQKNLMSMRTLITNHASIKEGFFTTKTKSGGVMIAGKPVEILPSSLYCYTIGRNITNNLKHESDPGDWTDIDSLEDHSFSDDDWTDAAE